jgi:hypothetical protein
MPATYHPVSPAVWDRTMRELTVESQAVRLYVLTCPTRVSEGLFTLAVGIIAHDVGLDELAVRRALDELEAAGLVAYDADAEVILDRTALRYTPLANGKKGEDKRIPAAVRKFEAVPDSPLKAEALGLAKAYSPDLHRALLERATEAPVRTPAEVASVFAEGASGRAEGASERMEAPSRAGPEKSRELRGALALPVGSR